MPSGTRKRLSIVYPGDMNFRQRGEEILRLRRLLRAANKRTRDEKKRWDEKCPQGHLIRYDECDLTCHITLIDPMPSVFMSALPKVTAKQLMGTWAMDDLSAATNWEAFRTHVYSLFDAFGATTERRVGWWWRVPYGWWLKLWRKK